MSNTNIIFNCGRF